MNSYKTAIQQNICYTKLVYGRINKKLNLELSEAAIEQLVQTIILETSENEFIKKGKNIYVTNHIKAVKLTINAFTYRIITADKTIPTLTKPKL